VDSKASFMGEKKATDAKDKDKASHTLNGGAELQV
jgi:hypothetical protein